MTEKKFLTTLVISTLLFSGVTFAEGKDNFPGSGNLAGSYAGTSKHPSYGGPWTSKKDKANSYDESPIAGSVSKVSNEKWVAKIFNNSKSTYSVRYEVVQYDSNHSRLKSESFTNTLSTGQSRSIDISALARTASCEINLLSARDLTPEVSKKDS